MLLVARRWLPFVAAPFLASCVFLLDYDDLQKGGPAAGGAPVAEGGAPEQSGAVSGAGGAPPACGECDDHDACTVDSCDETGDKPVCNHQAAEGLKLDGFETTLTSPRHVRVSVAAGGQQFYFATLEGDQSGPKVTLHRLASDGSELETIGADLQLEGTPVSNVGLAIESLPLGEVALHGFVATKLKAALPARVFHVVNRGRETKANVAGLSYGELSETLFPQALAIGDEIVGAWIQADGTIAVHNVGKAKTDVLGSSASATTLSLLSTSDARPAVLFTAQASAPTQLASGTYVETVGQNRSMLAECEARSGQYLSSSVIGTQIPGLWLANVTRFGDDYLTTGGGTIACGDSACVAAGEDCAKATPSNGVRNVAGATVRFEADPPGIIYSVVAIPQIRVSEKSTVEARLSLALGRADFSVPGEAASMPIGGDESGLMLIAQNDTDEALAFAGPDWPAVAILPTKQVAVAWIQPNTTADGTELHIQRYKMCLSEP